MLDLLRFESISSGDYLREIDDGTLFRFAVGSDPPRSLRECAYLFQRVAHITGLDVPPWNLELLPSDKEESRRIMQLVQQGPDWPSIFILPLRDGVLPLAQVRIAAEITGLPLTECAARLASLAAALGWVRPRFCDEPALLTRLAAIDDETWQRVRGTRSLTLRALLEYAAQNTPPSGARLAPLLHAMRLLKIEGPGCEEAALLALPEVLPIDARLARYVAAWKHFRGERPASAGLVVALCALVEQPAAVVLDRLTALSQVTGLPPPDETAEYLGNSLLPKK